MNDIVRKVAYCPHCSNRAPQRVIHRQKFFEPSWSASDGTESEPVPWSNFIVVCETCNRILIYDNPADGYEENEFTYCNLLYPDSGRLHGSVPKLISKVYEEASRIKKIAPNAFAVQIRRALEALCEDRGAKRGNLQNRLSKLAEKGDIPPLLSEVSDVLRFLGNIGAHIGEKSIHPLRANVIDEFFRAVVEYVYIAPSKLKRFKSEMKEYTKMKEKDA